MILIRKITWIFSSFLYFLSRLLILAGRFLEYSLTGQSDFKIHSEKISDFDNVNDLQKAKILMEQVRSYLESRFDMTLKSPVILELYTGNEFNFKGIIMELWGSVGRYHYENLGKSGIAHMVYIKKDLSKKRFMSVVAHELGHAYLRENRIINRNRYLREGFARWIEYKFLHDNYLKEEAEKLKNIKTARYGKEIQKFLKLEEKVGEKRVIHLISRIE